MTSVNQIALKQFKQKYNLHSKKYEMIGSYQFNFSWKITHRLFGPTELPDQKAVGSIIKYLSINLYVSVKCSLILHRLRTSKIDSHLNKMALSGVQKPHHQDYDARTLQQIPHDPVTFAKA